MPSRRSPRSSKPDPDFDVATYPVDFLTCRTIGHAWMVFHSGPSEDSAANYLMLLRCDRCKSERHDTVHRRGGGVHHRYVYVDGYRHKVKTKRTEYRTELVVRFAGRPNGRQRRRR